VDLGHRLVEARELAGLDATIVLLAELPRLKPIAAGLVGADVALGGPLREALGARVVPGAALLGAVVTAIARMALFELGEPCP
jgi:hypothetical protein